MHDENLQTKAEEARFEFDPKPAARVIEIASKLLTMPTDVVDRLHGGIRWIAWKRYEPCSGGRVGKPAVRAAWRTGRADAAATCTVTC